MRCVRRLTEQALTVEVEVRVARLHESPVHHDVRHVSDLLLINCSSRAGGICLTQAVAALSQATAPAKLQREAGPCAVCPHVSGMRCALSTLKAFQVLKPIAGLIPSPLSRATQRETASSTHASVTMLAGECMAVRGETAAAGSVFELI